MSAKAPILVALDGTERAYDVLDEAVVLARRLDTRLVLLRTITVTPAYAPAAMLVVASQVTHQQEAAQRDLDGLTNRTPSELLSAAILRLGTPWEAICHVAQEVLPQLIVIGFTPTGRFNRAGATQARVIEHAPCPVMVVRERVAPAA